ncbi:MAG: hypothetical protein SFU56_09160 [Capsulimonadales bacterium]|nr:hypothetical protein [Capsulimonadales bacterium]
MNTRNTKSISTTSLVVAAALGGIIVGQALPSQAQNFGDILKGGAVLVLVDKFSGQIDRFVNQITGNRTNNVEESTRVVPILTVGRGGYAGAVQVTGPKELVDQVKAVAQVEGQTRIGGQVRVRALIPVSTRGVSDLSKLSRVKGVGTSALIDLKL